MKKRNIGIACFFFLSLSALTTEKDFSLARKSLLKVLQNYQADSLMIPLKQEVFLSILKTNLTSEGAIFLQGDKFRMNLKGKPSSLTIFDGTFFWYQPDLKEKLVFRIKKPSEIQKLSSFFKAEAFFKVFKITNLVSREQVRVYQLHPLQDIQGLKEIYIKTNQIWILEMRFIWEDLNTSQKYTFSKPVFKQNPSSLFEWSQKEHRILEKEGF